MNKKILYPVIAASVAILAIGGSFIFRSHPPTEETPQQQEEKTEDPPKVYNYIEIHDACNWDRVGKCVNMRNGPGKTFKVVAQLRDGVVLKVGDIKEVDGLKWYRIVFGTELRYPERVEGDLYVAEGESIRYFEDEGELNTTRVNKATNKRIVVDVSEQTLYAYEGDDLFMKQEISTGLEFTPTPRGKFFVLRKTPSRYMQGPIEGVSDQYYDLPGVPWDLYFTRNGDVIHGAYWHNSFGQPWSHGCVNLPLDQAEELYKWTPVGTPVAIQD